jgi:tetratricopeptide (TPR) repeat protein
MSTQVRNGVKVRRSRGMALQLTLVNSFVALVVTLSAPSALADIVQDCTQREDGQLAIRACTEVLDNVRGDAAATAEGYYYRGVAHWKEGDLDSAIADFSEAIQHNSDLADAYVNRGTLYRSRGQLDDAADDFERAASLVDTALRDRPTEELSNLAKTINDKIAELRLESEMEALWVDYLKEIQTQGDYRNWSEPPHDLYLRK